MLDGACKQSIMCDYCRLERLSHLSARLTWIMYSSHHQWPPCKRGLMIQDLGVHAGVSHSAPLHWWGGLIHYTGGLICAWWGWIDNYTTVVQGHAQRAVYNMHKEHSNCYGSVTMYT